MSPKLVWIRGLVLGLQLGLGLGLRLRLARTAIATATGMFGQSESAQISSSFGLDDCIEIVIGILCKSQSLDWQVGSSTLSLAWDTQQKLQQPFTVLIMQPAASMWSCLCWEVVLLPGLSTSVSFSLARFLCPFLTIYLSHICIVHIMLTFSFSVTDSFDCFPCQKQIFTPSAQVLLLLLLLYLLPCWFTDQSIVHKNKINNSIPKKSVNGQDCLRLCPITFIHIAFYYIII